MLSIARAALLGTSVFLLSACGNNPLAEAFKNITLKNLDENGNAIIELKTEVGGGLLFSAGSLPIVDPKTGKMYGTISMERSLDGKNILTVSANVSGIKIGSVLTDNKLPNGDNVPVAGLTSLAAVPAGRNSRVYIGESQDKLMLGVAVAIEQFDVLSHYIPKGSMFFNISTREKNPGVAGFFVSPEPGKSGIALFMQTNMTGVNLPGAPAVMAKANMASVSVQDMTFITRKAKSADEQYFGYFVNRWSRAQTPLNVK